MDVSKTEFQVHDRLIRFQNLTKKLRNSGPELTRHRRYAGGRSNLLKIQVRIYKLKFASFILQAVFCYTHCHYFDEYNPSGDFGILICIFSQFVSAWLFCFLNPKETTSSHFLSP